MKWYQISDTDHSSLYLLRVYQVSHVSNTQTWSHGVCPGPVQLREMLTTTVRRDEGCCDRGVRSELGNETDTLKKKHLSRVLRDTGGSQAEQGKGSAGTGRNVCANSECETGRCKGRLSCTEGKIQRWRETRPERQIRYKIMWKIKSYIRLKKNWGVGGLWSHLSSRKMPWHWTRLWITAEQRPWRSALDPQLLPISLSIIHFNRRYTMIIYCPHTTSSMGIRVI